MDSYQNLKNYLAPKKTVKIVCLILALILAFCVFSIVKVSKQGNAPAVNLTSFTNSGEYCYIDVIVVSNWLYKYDEQTYYSVMDKNGYWYTARLSASQFRAMAPQYEYFLDSENTPQPEVYRLKGISRSTSSDIAENLSSAWDITQSEYYQYFGKIYLDATSTPAGEASALYLTFAIFCALLFIILAVGDITRTSRTKKMLERISALGEVDKAAGQLQQSGVTLEKEKIVFGDDYLFCAKNGVILKYSDIIWCFTRVQRYNFVAVSRMLMIYTPFIANICLAALSRPGKSDTEELIFKQIMQKNPNALIGFSIENSRLYKQRKKEAHTENEF